MMQQWSTWTEEAPTKQYEPNLRSLHLKIHSKITYQWLHVQCGAGSMSAELFHYPEISFLSNSLCITNVSWHLENCGLLITDIESPQFDGNDWSMVKLRLLWIPQWLLQCLIEVWKKGKGRLIRNVFYGRFAILLKTGRPSSTIVPQHSMKLI